MQCWREKSSFSQLQALPMAKVSFKPLRESCRSGKGGALILNPILSSSRHSFSKPSLVSLPSRLLNIAEMFGANNIFILSEQMMGLFPSKPPFCRDLFLQPAPLIPF